MPAAGPGIGAIATAVGTFLTSTKAIYVIARLVAFTAATAILAKRAFGFSPGLEARAITSRGTVEPQQRIYGRALVSGPVIFNDVSGVVNRDLWVVIPIAGHRISSIGDVWLDANIVTNAQINGGAAGGGLVTSGKFAPVDGYDILQIWKHLGTSTQTVNTSLDSAFTAWTSAHRLRGLSYLAVRMTLLERAQELWNGAEPSNIRAEAYGALVYDPRLDSTQTGLSPAGSGSHRYDDPATWAWSDNPALCVADYLIDSRFGLGLAPTRIDWQSVLDAAEHCEELVDIPGPTTEQRYRCNGSLYGTETHRENLGNLLSSMNGEVTVSAGQWFVRAGEYSAASVAFTADHVIAPLGIKANLERGDRFNTIKGVFVDKDAQFKPSETPPVTTTTLQDRDNGRILETEVDLPFTDRYYMAQRLLWKQLHIADQEMQVSTRLNLKAATAAIGDRITLDIDELAWNPKTFKLTGWKLAESGDDIGIDVELREDASAAYDDPLIANYTTRNTAGVITFADPTLGPPRAYDWFTSDDFGHGDVARFLGEWSEVVSSGGEISMYSGGGVVGQYAVDVGNVSGNDEFWRGVDRRDARPVLAGEIYRIGGWLARLNGTGSMYLGVNGFAGDVRSGGGVAVNAVGSDSLSGQHYFGANSVTPGTTSYVWYEGYFKLGTTTASVYNAGTIDDPHELHRDVEYVAPLVILNYNGVAGRCAVDFVELERFDGRTVPILGVNVRTSTGVVVPDAAVVRVTIEPPGLNWDTYQAGGWSPADTTRSVLVSFYRGATFLGSRVLDATLTASGANEGDIAVAGGTSSGEATSVSVTNNNTAAVYATVTHTASGVQAIAFFGSALPGYSAGVSK